MSTVSPTSSPDWNVTIAALAERQKVSRIKIRLSFFKERTGFLLIGNFSSSSKASEEGEFLRAFTLKNLSKHSMPSFFVNFSILLHFVEFLKKLCSFIKININLQNAIKLSSKFTTRYKNNPVKIENRL